MQHPAPQPAIPTLAPLAQLAGSRGWRLALPHAVDAVRVVWIARGNGGALIDGQSQGVAPNCALHVPSRALFALERAAQIEGLVLTLPAAAGIALPGAMARVMVPSRQAQAELATLATAMRGEAAALGPFHAEAARAHAELITVWLRRRWHEAATRPEAPPAVALRPDQKLAQAFARRLAGPADAGRTVAAEAAALGVTPTHLTRACQRAAGQGAGALQAGRLLHAARLALADSDEPVGRIAADLGFGSAAYFTRFIQNQTGLTPTKLRETASARRPS